MALIRYQRPEVGWELPFRNISTLRDEMDQLIDRMFESPCNFTRETQLMGNWAPAVDLYEAGDNLLVKAELPGMKKEDIEITLHDNMLSISGERVIERKAEAADTYRSERFEGRFHRTFTLPAQVNADKITASYNEGILTVTLPKAENAKAKQIPVSVK